MADSLREAAIAGLRRLLDPTDPMTSEVACAIVEDAIAALRIGPVGTHPEGQLDPNDRGALQVGITARDGKVIVAFGTPVDWIGLGPSQARLLAKGLLATAAQLDGAQRSRHDDHTQQAQGGHGEGRPTQAVHPDQDPILDPRD